MPDNRDQSRQKRSKENRAARSAVQARKAAAAKKGDGEQPADGQRKTRAQAAPVRGGGKASAAGGAAGGGRSGGATRAAARPPVGEPDPNAPWIRRVLQAPGGRWALLAFVLAILVTVVILVLSGPRSVERWNTKLKGREITACVTTKSKKVQLAEGQTVEQVCGYKDLSQKQRKSDSRKLARVDARLLDLYGPVILAYLAIPVLASGVALAFAARPNRRRVFGYSALMYAFWVLFLGLSFGFYFVVSFGALAYAWYQARKADPPIRPERGARPAGAGGGMLGGLFGRRQPAADRDVIDADVVDEADADTSTTAAKDD